MLHPVCPGESLEFHAGALPSQGLVLSVCVGGAQAFSPCLTTLSGSDVHLEENLGSNEIHMTSLYIFPQSQSPCPSRAA